jgi:3-hydroxybutyryl-CoA dehydratase
VSLAGDRVRVGHAVEYETALSNADLGQFLDIGEAESPGPITDESMVETGDAGQVVPGMLAGSLISTALSRLPGVAVHLSQDLSFHNPARVGSVLTVECEVVENLGRDRYRLRTRVLDGDAAVADGEAMVRIDDWPET